MCHIQDSSVLLLINIFASIHGCGSIVGSTVVNLRWRVLRNGNEHVENAKNRYGRLVSVLARHLKMFTATSKHMKLTWYSFYDRK
jgi:hypothetical protein